MITNFFDVNKNENKVKFLYLIALIATQILITMMEDSIYYVSDKYAFYDEEKEEKIQIYL